MIDAHCHLNDEKYSDYQVGQIVAEAEKNGVVATISNGAGVKNSERAIEISHKHSLNYAAVGLGYEEAREKMDEDFEKLEKLVEDPKVVAVGEAGLDYWPDMKPDLKTIQLELFKKHVEFAKKTNLPLVIHCRSAFEDVYNLVKETGLVGQMHCWTGNEEWMKKFVEIGWYISFGGILTFKSSHDLRAMAAAVPEDKLLIETDSPYLAPEPIRGTVNTPSNLKLVAEVLAKTRGVSIDRIEEVTTENARRLFRL